MWSGPTNRDGTVAEVVEVGSADATALTKFDLKGKLALVSRNPAGLKWKLAQMGSLGAISAFTENPTLEDDRQWLNSWGDRGWAFNKGDSELLAFSITPRQAKELRLLLAKGSVKVKANVDSRYYAGSYPYVTGVIPGKSSEEVLALGHTSEPGAHDNATGVAAIVEAVATINRLIRAGQLPRPQRSIRVLLMGELYGSLHYLENNPERMRRTVAAMCLDTPAGPYQLAGTEYTFYGTPDAAASYVDAFVMRLAEEHFGRTRPVRMAHSRPYMSGTDNYLSDPLIGIPTAWPYAGTGIHSHHNSADVPETVDPKSLRDLSVMTASYLYYLAAAGDTDAAWLRELAVERAYGRLTALAGKHIARVFASDKGQDFSRMLLETREELKYASERGQQAVSSTHRLAPALDVAQALEKVERFAEEQISRVEAALQKQASQLGRREPVKIAARPINGAAARIVPRRKRFGPIPFDDIPEDKREGFPSAAWATGPLTALYWTDGKRNLDEIVRLTMLELGPQKLDFTAYFRFLEKNGYVEFVP
jgi:hypothetical protein